MRLIDADRLQKQFNAKSNNPNYRVNMHNIKSIINNSPTVEAVPKADYEARLKADLVSMLTELQLEIEELDFFEGEEPVNITQELMDEAKSWECGVKDCKKLIQSKIDKMKGDQTK